MIERGRPSGGHGSLAGSCSLAAAAFHHDRPLRTRETASLRPSARSIPFGGLRSLAAALLALAIGAPLARAAFPVEIHDDRGRTITLTAPAHRVVVAGPPLFAQILDELGAADLIVGIATSPEVPPRFRDTPTVGGVDAVSVERVLALRPDLVLGAFGPAREGLEAAGLVCVTTKPSDDIAGVLRTVDEVEHAIRGEGNAARALAERLTTEVAATEARIAGRPRPRVALLYPLPGSPPLTSGPGTPEHEFLLKAGGENVFADVPGYHRVSYEEILRRDPDAIVIDPTQIEWTRTNEVIASLRAVRTGRVLQIRPSNWVSTRFPDTIRTVAAWLHPDAFTAAADTAAASAPSAASATPMKP